MAGFFIARNYKRNDAVPDRPYLSRGKRLPFAGRVAPAKRAKRTSAATIGGFMPALAGGTRATKKRGHDGRAFVSRLLVLKR